MVPSSCDATQKMNKREYAKAFKKATVKAMAAHRKSGHNLLTCERCKELSPIAAKQRAKQYAQAKAKH